MARAGTWDTWAFACVSVSPTDQKKIGFLVEAGEAPLANLVRIIQDFRPPKEGFGLIGSPRFTLCIGDKYLPLDQAEVSIWQSLLHKGVSKMKTARDNWEQWSASPPDHVAPSSAG